MLGDHVNIHLKRGVKIITCDPDTQTIEAETRNGEVISVNAYHFGSVFRWPEAGESWMVREENGSWYLDGIYEEMQPSEDSGGGGEEALSLSGYVEVPAAKGVTLGTFEIPAQKKARFILCIFVINQAENSGSMTVAGNVIAITERSGSVGTNYRTTLTIVLPANTPCLIKGNNPEHVSIDHLWESV